MKRKLVIATICLFPMILSSCCAKTVAEKQKIPVPECINSIVTYGHAIECLVMQNEALQSYNKEK